MGNLAMYLLPGMTAIIKAENSFAEMGKVLHTYPDERGKTATSTTNGFVVDNTDVGVIEPVEGKAAVKYTHKKYAANAITFYARNSAMGRCDIISVPIHDHASIITGGPAFGTYFSDDETVKDSSGKGGSSGGGGASGS